MVDDISEMYSKLESDQSEDKISSAIAIRELKKKEAIPKLIEVLKEEKNPAVFDELIKTLGELKALESIEVIILTTLKPRHGWDDDPKKKIFANFHRVVALQEEMDGNPHKVACAALRKMGPKAIPVILDGMKNYNPKSTPSGITEALGSLIKKTRNTKKYLKMLLKFAFDKSNHHRARGNVAWLIGFLEYEEAISDLIRIYHEDEEQGPKWGAVFGLGLIAIKDGISQSQQNRIIQFLNLAGNDKNSSVRMAAMNSIGKINQMRAFGRTIDLSGMFGGR